MEHGVMVFTYVYSGMKEWNKRFEYWLGYFMYEEGKKMHISFQNTNVNMEMLKD